jgi:hypothetical protein
MRTKTTLAFLEVGADTWFVALHGDINWSVACMVGFSREVMIRRWMERRWIVQSGELGLED